MQHSQQTLAVSDTVVVITVFTKEQRCCRKYVKILHSLGLVSAMMFCCTGESVELKNRGRYRCLIVLSEGELRVYAIKEISGIVFVKSNSDNIIKLVII